MTRHELKLWPDQFSAMQHGIKRADVRRCDDRDFRRHDEVLYREHWGSSGKYSGRALLARVTHLVRWAGELELIGMQQVTGAIKMVKIVVLSIEILEVGDYKKLKETKPVAIVGEGAPMPRRDGQP
jgi:hypothetical protein